MHRCPPAALHGGALVRTGRLPCRVHRADAAGLQHPTPARRPVVTAAAAAAAPGPWPEGGAEQANLGGAPPPRQPPRRGPEPHSAAAALGAVLLAAQDAAEDVREAVKAAGRRLRRLQVWAGKPEALLIREGCQLMACLLFILLYVWSTYTPVVPGSGRWWADLLLSLLFAADYVHRTLTTSAHPLVAALHPLALIDLLSFAPSLLGALLPETMGPWGIDLRWFRVFRALRLLRLSLLSGNLSTMKTNRGVLIAGSLNVPLVWLVASVVSWMFTSASCVAVMEKLPWHDALYFVGSTLTTVGYGDVVVRSSMGRLFVLVMMLVGVVLIPVRAGQLYSRLSQRLLMAGHQPGDGPGCRGGYVVLSGRLSDVRGFNDFLQDFLVQVRHLSAPGAPGPAAGGRQGLQLVCLCNKPSVEFLALQELHESHLTLVEGSAFSERDLISRAGLTGSLGVMVLADRFSSNAAAEDTDVQFRVWAIKATAKRVPLYVQVLRRSAVDVISPFLDPAQDVIMSVEGTRMRLLALSALVPGASTLIANLLRSSGPNAGFAVGPQHPRGGSNGSARRALRSLAASGAASGGWGSSSDSRQRPSLDITSLSSSDSPTSSREDAPAWVAASQTQWQQGAREPSRNGRSGGDAAAKLAGRRWLREYADGAHHELFFCAAGPPLAGLRFAGAAEAVYEATGGLLVGVIEPKRQRLVLNPSNELLQQGQQLVVLAAARSLAEAAAAGHGLEAALYTQALRAAQAAAAAAAAAAAVAVPGDEAALQGAAEDHAAAPVQQLPGVVQPPPVLLQQQQHQQAQQYTVVVQQAQDAAALKAALPSAAASTAAGAAQQQLSVAGAGVVPVRAQPTMPQAESVAGASMDGGGSSNGGGSHGRAFKVRVPQLMLQDLVRASRDFDEEDSSGSAGGRGGPSRAGGARRSSSSGGGGAAGKQGGAASADVAHHHSVEQQPRLQQRGAAAAAQEQERRQQQQQQQQQQQPAAAGAAFAEGGHYADVYAAFARTQQASPSPRSPAGPPLLPQQRPGGGSPTAEQEDADDEGELSVAGCLAPWSGAFESDSLDETELCSDDELQEEAVRQQQRQQRHADRQQQQQLVDASAASQAAYGSGGEGPQPVHLEQPASAQQQPLEQQQGAAAQQSPTAAELEQQHHQQPYQQQPQSSQPAGPAGQGQDPRHLAGHIIVAGCATSFVQFARQLAASAAPTGEPPCLVLLHPDNPGAAALEEVRRMGLSAHHVAGRSSDAAALVAAGARRARSLVFLGPSERPTHLPATAVSGLYGDPTTTREAAGAAHHLAGDATGSSRTAVLADADALSSCYGVGEVFLPDSLSTIVELGFTSSIRFLQPGLLLHGRPPPHTRGSRDEAPALASPLRRLGQLLPGGTALLAGLAAGLGGAGGGAQRRAAERGNGSSGGGGQAVAGGEQQQQQQPAVQRLLQAAAGGPAGDSYLPTGSPAASRADSPAQTLHDGSRQPRRRQQEQQQQEQQQQQQLWPWWRQRHSQLPRSSYRHRKEIEEAGQLEGLTEWQLNSYYAAGRVMVPALLDVFTCQGFFKRQALLDLLAELAGDDGRPGGAMLQQLPVPGHLVGRTYQQLVQHYLTHPEPQQRHLALGLLRRKAENRAWRLPYVATHPHPDTQLQATDLVFVIRPQ